MLNNKYNHPSLKALHLRSTVAEVDNACREANLFQTWQYVKDKEFELFVLKDILTLKQAKAFIAMLNADCQAIGYTHACQKTWDLSRISVDRKKYKFLSFASLIASARRTCCGCHETGSFALSSHYHIYRRSLDK